MNVETIIKSKRTGVTQLCEKYRVRRLELFGSAASGRFDPSSSDLDFAVEFLPTTPGEHASATLGCCRSYKIFLSCQLTLLSLRQCGIRTCRQPSNRPRAYCMRPEVRKLLYDIRQACELLVQFTKRKSLADYAADPLLRSAVERQFEIVGEALSQATKIEPVLTERATDTRRIINFHNILIHGYAAISNEAVWGIIETGLPKPHSEVRALLDQQDGP